MISEEMSKPEEVRVMLARLIRRLLPILYPLLVLVAVTLIWSETNLAEVTSLTPPVNDGFNVFWNPLFTRHHACGQEERLKQPFRQSCSAE